MSSIAYSQREGREQNRKDWCEYYAHMSKTPQAMSEDYAQRRADLFRLEA